MTLVENAHRHKHHARADVEAARDQKIQICLLKFQLAGFLEPLDKGVLQFQLADKTDPLREAVIEEQHEPMKIHPGVEALILVEMEIHVPGNWTGLRRGLRRLRVAPPGGQGEKQKRSDAKR